MKKNILFFLIIALVTSCVEDIDLPLKSSGTRMLVVEGQITTDTTAHWIKLSYTADYYNNVSDPVEDATVTVTDGETAFVLTEDPQHKGLFTTAADVYGLPGKTYTLTITGIDTDKDGETETYTAESVMPAFPKVDSIQAGIFHKFFTDVLQVDFWGEDSPTPGEAYLYKVTINNVMVTDSLNEWGFSDDEVYNGQKAIAEPVMYLDQKQEQYVAKDGDVIGLEYAAIPYQYYKFLFDAVWEWNGADPFGGNPANIRTNITGPRKAWGFFTTNAIVRKSAILKGEE